MPHLWPAILCGAVSLLHFIAASVPKWQTRWRWGKFGKGPQMGPATLRLIGLLFATFGFDLGLDLRRGPFARYLAAVYIAIFLLLAFYAYPQDRRRDLADESSWS